MKTLVNSSLNPKYHTDNTTSVARVPILADPASHNNSPNKIPMHSHDELDEYRETLRARVVEGLPQLYSKIHQLISLNEPDSH